uniref:Uncharacterized protein n=2 Tax=Eutreptiella gymnastica TaxID=73025 RepID=A0A7S1JD78_9EUGL|mmetsp:Transcript_87056/g.151475  ORF Transcript_87056/g.151475 Transcript_87056/m.151475 type:complete len:337 (+) Transcript_87056:107-1117(+)
MEKMVGRRISFGFCASVLCKLTLLLTVGVIIIMLPATLHSGPSDIPLNHGISNKALASAATPLTPKSAAPVTPNTETSHRIRKPASSISTSHDVQDGTSVDAELALKATATMPVPEVAEPLNLDGSGTQPRKKIKKKVAVAAPVQPEGERWNFAWTTRASRNRTRTECVEENCPPPFVCNTPDKVPPLPTGDRCKSYVTINPDAQGLGHAHANRNTALLIALELADLGVCYAHPSIKARHVHDQKVWDHWLGFEVGWKFAPTLLKDATLKQVQLPTVSPFDDLVADIRKQYEPNTIYILPFHQDTFDHCPSAAIWRSLYDKRRLKDEKPKEPFINT